VEGHSNFLTCFYFIYIQIFQFADSPSLMRKQIFTVLSTGLLLASLPFSALASDASGSYTAASYAVSVPQDYMVPYAYSEDGYFENGLVAGFGSAVTFKGLNEEGQMEFYAVTDRGPNADAPQYSSGGTVTDAKI